MKRNRYPIRRKLRSIIVGYPFLCVDIINGVKIGKNFIAAFAAIGVNVYLTTIFYTS